MLPAEKKQGEERSNSLTRQAVNQTTDATVMFQLFSYIVWQRNRAAIFMAENTENNNLVNS